MLTPANANAAGRTRRLSLIGLALLATLLGLGQPGQLGDDPASAQSPAVSVYPIPGSRLASPQTQIAFRGLPENALGQIRVTGSRTGAHAGQLEADSDGRGASFIPATPFAAGETVTVTTSLNVLRAAHHGTFHFQVASPATGIPRTGRLHVRNVPGGVWRFHSRSDLAPPAVRITHGAGAGGNTDIFLAPQYGPAQNGPEIVDSRGQLIWFDPMPAWAMATNLQVQRYRGKPVLTWWQGYSNQGMGLGQDVITDSSYRQVAVVKAANGLSADLHEFQLTPAGTALITAFYPVHWNAASVHGSKREIVFDCVIQEIDVPTGLVLFQWDSLDHVGLGDSYKPLPPENRHVGFHNPYDYFHINSIQREGDGNLLISARNTWAAYKLDHRTGGLFWTLGGKRSSFRMLSGAGFAFQHDVRSHARGDRFVTVFDDGAGLPAVHSQSRALELNLDFKHHTARVFKQWGHAPRLLALFEGNTQQLPDLDEFVGWGQQPYFTEFNQRRRTVFDGRFVSNTASYRAYRFSWNATPATPPTVAATSAGSQMTVYASWNGATAAASWRVLTGSSPSALSPAATAAKSGFETSIQVPRAAYVSVQALDSSGRVLGVSPSQSVP